MKNIKFLTLSIIVFFTSSPCFSGNYDRDGKVKDYIEEYSNNWNRNYKWFGKWPTGNNCANFVSQALRAGGYAKEMNLHFSDDKYRDNCQAISTVDKLEEFLEGISDSSKEIDTSASVPSELRQKIKIGDMIILKNPYLRRKHAIIVSNIDGGIKYAANTTNRLNYVLYSDDKGWNRDVIGFSEYNRVYIYFVKDEISNPLYNLGKPGCGEEDVGFKDEYFDDVQTVKEFITSILTAKDPNIMYGPEGQVVPGQTMTYTVEFENIGQGIAYGVYVTDIFSEYLDDSNIIAKDFYSIDYNANIVTPANYPFNYDSETKVLSVLVDELGPKKGGKFTVELKLKDNTPQGTVISNHAIVYFPSVPETTPTNSIISVVPSNSQIMYTGDIGGRYSDYALFQSTLTAISEILSGKTVIYSIGQTTYTAMTNFEGIAYAYQQVLLNPGQYAFKAEFPGDGYYYLPSEFTGTFTVEKENTVLSKPDAEVIYPSTAIINIGMSDEEGEEILNQLSEPKTVYLEYKDSGTYKTIDQTILSSGIANFEFELPKPLKRKYELQARFEGDSKYNSSISTGTLFVIDKTPPEIAITSPKAGEKYAGRTPIKIEYTVIDDLDPNPTSYAFLTYLADSSTMQVQNGAEIMPLDLESGYWTMTVKASDIDNNISSFTIGKFEILHDIMPPRTKTVISDQWSVTGEGITYVTSNTSFTVTSIDDLVELNDRIGLGVKQQKIEIRSQMQEARDIIFENGNPVQGGIFVSTFTVERFQATDDRLQDGSYDLNYNAEDIAGNIESTQTLKIIIDNTPPISLINSPMPQSKGIDKIFNKELSINISVSDEYLKNYKLEIAEGENAESNFNILYESTSAVNNKEIYTLNTKDYSQGYYSIKLEAEDFAGNRTITISNVYIGKPQIELIIEGLNKPEGAAADKLGNIYISDTQKNIILKLNQTGEILAKFSGIDQNTKEKGLKNPTGIAVDNDFNIYIADQDNHRLAIMNQYGNIIKIIGKINPEGKPKPGKKEKELHSPTGVAVSIDRIVVADKDSIKIFDKNADFIFEITDDGKQKYFDIAIDEQGNIYATDTKNNKVLMYDKNGEPINAIDDLKEPKGIDTSEYIYIADEKSGEILKYNAKKNLLLEFDLKRPYALALDKESNLYITDREKGKLHKFVLNPQVSAIKIKLKEDGKFRETKKERIISKNGKIFVNAEIGEIVQIKVYDSHGQETDFKEFSAPKNIKGVFKYTYSLKEASLNNCEIKLNLDSNLIEYRKEACAVINIELK
ncbi:MAG: amidase domain-containing protein [Elusimicrobia bacterium]|nr:amidase domain-containing protein [Elusimicrobiota bacterium]